MEFWDLRTGRLHLIFSTFTALYSIQSGVGVGNDCYWAELVAIRRPRKQQFQP